MKDPDYDSDFIRQVACARTRALPAAVMVVSNPDAPPDPTFDIRRKQANLCEAVMLRVFELEAQAAALTETAKKLRASVLANT